MYRTDMPIKQKEEDLLGRAGFARDLAKAIIGYSSKETLCIGVFGKWGSGKTSVINMMLEEIEQMKNPTEKEKVPLVIHFEPWNFSGSDQLLNQFFVRLTSIFKGKKGDSLSAVGEALESYASAFEVATVIPKVGPIIALAGKYGLSSVGKTLKKAAENKDISKQKDEVIKLLSEQSRKILIVIDDIDRLGNEQIRQVFQLVTAVAKFPNIMYLMSFDRDIVVKALEQVQEGDGNEYLQKIIQVPIEIPNTPKVHLRAVLLENLTSVFESYKNKVLFNEKRWTNLFEYCVIPYIKTLRDVNRLCNLVQFKLSSISTEVEFGNMVCISSIELFIPGVYEWIKKNKCVLTGETDWEFRGLEELSAKELKEKYGQKLTCVLSRNKNVFVDAEDLEMVLKSLTHLFPHFGRKVGMTYEVIAERELRHKNQIGHPEKFDRYFSLDIEGVSVKRNLIQRAIEDMSETELIEFLIDKSEDKVVDTVLAEMRACLPQVTSERAKVIASALLEAGYSLEGSSGALMLNIKMSAEVFILELIGTLLEDERMPYLLYVIEHMTVNSMQMFATVLNTIELAHGRLAANGVERGSDKLITLEGLAELENRFVEKIKTFLFNGYNVLEAKNSRMILYLLGCFDNDYTKMYMNGLLQESRNRLLYLELSVSRWIGGDIDYEIRNDYLDHLSTEQVIETINETCEKDAWHEFEATTKWAVAAFYLHEQGKTNYHGHISQNEVDKLLTEWNAL